MSYKQNICLDFITNLFCMPCAVCQEFREVICEAKSNLSEELQKSATAMQNEPTESDPLNPKND